MLTPLNLSIVYTNLREKIYAVFPRTGLSKTAHYQAITDYTAVKHSSLATVARNFECGPFRSPEFKGRVSTVRKTFAPGGYTMTLTKRFLWGTGVKADRKIKVL